MTSDEIKDKINQIHAISLKDIIEMYGGTFYNGGKQFSHPSLGYEKTPSGFIYARNGKEHWKHFKEGIGGDAGICISHLISVSADITCIFIWEISIDLSDVIIARIRDHRVCLITVCYDFTL